MRSTYGRGQNKVLVSISPHTFLSIDLHIYTYMYTHVMRCPSWIRLTILNIGCNFFLKRGAGSCSVFLLKGELTVVNLSHAENVDCPVLLTLVFSDPLRMNRQDQLTARVIKTPSMKAPGRSVDSSVKTPSSN